MLHYGLTSLGVFHTIISLLALGSGAYALIRDGKIVWENKLSKFYIVMTIIICLTGFGIFQHGGFGKAHMLGVITLITIAVAFAAGPKISLFGRASRYIEVVAYSLTFFFNIVPTITESLTRLPYGAPFATSPEDGTIQKLTGLALGLTVIGIVIQVRKMRPHVQPIK